MEVEHGHNTANIYEQSQKGTLGHFNPHSSQTNFSSFLNKADKDFGGLKRAAQ